MWECQKCHERHEDSFEVCWNCGTSKTGFEDPAFRAAEEVDPESLGQVDPVALAQPRSQQGEEVEPRGGKAAEGAGGHRRAAYEFTPEQNEVIAGLASNMKVVGIVSVIAGILLVVAGFVLLARGDFSAIFQGILALVFGWFTLQAAAAFRQIVNSQGDDIRHLMTALGVLRSLYLLQVILLCIALGILALAFCLVATSGR